MDGVIWLAVSSKKQTDNVSLGEQLRRGLHHAERHSVNVAGALVVPGESRSITLFDRAAQRVRGFYLSPEAIRMGQSVGIERYIKQEPLPVGVEPVMVYAKFLELAEADAFKVFFFLNRNRLGRKASLSMAVVGVCEDNDIKVFDMESPPTSLERTANRDERYMGAFKSVEGENQIIKLQEDHKSGMIRRVEQGKMPGLTNFGYIPLYNERGKLSGYAVDEEAATTVRMIFELYLEKGLGTLNIADHLNRMGRPARGGGEWSESQVRRQLSYAWRYAGFAELNVNSRTGRPYVRAKGIWPALITEEQATATFAEREARMDARRSVYTVYRFTRMCYCAVCGARLHTQTRTNHYTVADGTRKEYTYIFSRCPMEHVTIGYKKISAALAAYIRQLDDEAFRNQILDKPTVSQAASIAADIVAYEAQAQRLQKGIAQADFDYYSRGALAEDAPRYQAVVSALKKQIVAIQAEITKLQDRLQDEKRFDKQYLRIDDMRINGLKYLEGDDVRECNIKLRGTFKVYVQDRQVVEIEVI